ncbi:type I restriction-modification system subunit M N-terminal domain-containing protein [Halovulum dunhuangense]|uniref:Type I restriction-modification system subunit M N-terminal domain-containing protein n=1 Tax=Halovulum dunhuangense TaxID=1505036 RepID=A0A849L859_9RHOB|nr:type I restriction-modification system subunit M N-terminal domain-containing protein [Halovulum dunhuangense]NNU82201.1 type I restriction-modification system subunit M N-terminal domain-containing protein [Halovulum dunhuangense]
MSQSQLSSLIWSVADLLRGDYRQSEYGRVILPLTVLRRLDCVLEPTKAAVLREKDERTRAGLNPDPFMRRVSGAAFYNASPLDMRRLAGDQDNIGPNLLAYGLQAKDPTKDGITPLIAARLMHDFALAPTGERGRILAEQGFEWRYHRKEEPDKKIYLLTDRGTMSLGDLAILLSRSSMAPVDKYFNQVRRRIKAFDRGSRPTSGDGAWYVNAFYRPEMINKVSTILRFYHNFMLVESEDTRIPKSERRTPAMKIGLAKGKVYMRDLLSFG